MTDHDELGTTTSAAMTDDPATAVIDVQDPLPESNFFYRRVFAYVSSTILVGLLAYVTFKMQTPESLRTMALYLSLLLWFSITYYMLAPSAEQLVRIIQAGRALRSGVEMTRTARVDRREGTAEARTTARPRRAPERRSRGPETYDAAPRSRRR